MRPPIVDSAHIKNKILLCIYVFRSLPVLYFETISSHTSQTKEETRLIILNLLQGSVVKKTIADNGAVYLRLTRKGYLFVVKHFLSQEKNPLYTFRRDRGVNHKISDHDYYNFVFVWDYISKNPQTVTNHIQIYDDSNLNSCRVSFSLDSKRIVIAPDILILIPDARNVSFKKALFVENDAGGETYRQVFEKILEYAMLLSMGMAQNALSQASIYFIFHSQERVQELFFGKTSILPFFDFTNSSKKIKRIPIDCILSAFSQSRIFFSVYKKERLPTPLTFTQYELPTLLLERRPEWQIYL